MTTNNTEEALKLLTGDYYLDDDHRADIANVIKKLDNSNEINELQERLDCIKKILDEAYYVEPLQHGILDNHVDGYRKKGVARAHRVATVEALPKKVK